MQCRDAIRRPALNVLALLAAVTITVGMLTPAALALSATAAADTTDDSGTLAAWAVRLVPDASAVDAALNALALVPVDFRTHDRARDLAERYRGAIATLTDMSEGAVNLAAVRAQIDELDAALRRDAADEELDEASIAARRASVVMLRQRVLEAEIVAGQEALRAAERLADDWSALADSTSEAAPPSPQSRAVILRTARRLRIAGRLHDARVLPEADLHSDFIRPLDLTALVIASAGRNDALGMALRRRGVDPTGPLLPRGQDAALLSILDTHDERQASWLRDAASAFLALDASALGDSAGERWSWALPVPDDDGRREAFLLHRRWADDFHGLLTATGEHEAAAAWATAWRAMAAPKIHAAMWLESDAPRRLAEISERVPAFADQFLLIAAQASTDARSLDGARSRAFETGAQFAAAEGTADAPNLSARYTAALGQLRALHTRAIRQMVEAVAELTPEEARWLELRIEEARASEPWRFSVRERRR